MKFKEMMFYAKAGIKESNKGFKKYFLILWFGAYLFLNFILNEIGTIGFHLFGYVWYILIPFMTFMILNAVLVSISINLGIHKFKQIQLAGIGGAGLGAVGTFLALMTGACPGCIAGFFPVIMGLIGSSITLSQLPLYGLELQFVSIPILLAGIHLLSKPIACKPKLPPKK